MPGVHQSLNLTRGGSGRYRDHAPGAQVSSNVLGGCAHKKNTWLCYKKAKIYHWLYYKKI